MIMVHRCTMGETAEAVAEGYRTVRGAREATGGKMPYAVVVYRDGTVVQSASLTDITPHAAAYNRRAIGVACIGDFRLSPPAQEQWDSLIWVLHRLRDWSGHRLSVHGHTEFTRATRDASKQCPGRHLSMALVRDAVESRSLLEIDGVGLIL